MEDAEQVVTAINKKKKKRGSVKNADRLEAFTRKKVTERADWAEAGSELIAAVVVGVTALGGAVIFGMSRDQGAHSLTLLLDGKNAPLWFNGDADLDEALQEVVDTLQAIA